jgi:hypothetical protein
LVAACLACRSEPRRSRCTTERVTMLRAFSAANAFARASAPT